MKIKIIRVVSFFLFITAIPILTFSGEKKSVSYNENRVLAKFPRLSAQSWKSRSFMKGLDDYFSDRFVGREKLIKLKNALNRGLGKEKINGVVRAGDSLVMLFDDADPSVTERNIAALNGLKAKNPEVPFYFMPVVTAQEKLKDSIPGRLRADDESRYVARCFEKLDGVEKIDVTREILKTRDAFYRSDHHWTTRCAYAAYAAAGEALGYSPKPESRFRIKTVAEDFRGSLYSKTLDDKIKPDRVEAYFPESELVFTVGDKTYSSLYFYDKLGGKDKYLFFMGGNYGVCNIESRSARTGGKLLIIKDSYADCFVPFLTGHFSWITVVDPRYCAQKALAALRPSDFDLVLVLYSVIGFSQEKKFPVVEFMGGAQTDLAPD